MQNHLRVARIWGLPKIRGTFLGVRIVRITVLVGLCLGSPIYEATTYFLTL